MRTLAILALLCTSPLLAQNLVGTWTGAWTKASDSLPVTVRLEAAQGRLAGSFSSDDLQVLDIPLVDIETRGDAIRFSLRGDSSTITFAGLLDRDTLSGRLVDGITEGQFNLQRDRAIDPAILSRDIVFYNGGIRLAGTLLLPSQPGRHPAILMLQGSGPEGRWAKRYLAYKFASAGFVALIYDKRGVGNSAGEWQTAGFETLAGDAAAAIQFLHRQPEVDASRVGIYGHSQGATIAPLVVARSPTLAFVLAAAAGGIDPAEVELYSVSNLVGLRDLPPAERSDAAAYVRTLVDTAYRAVPRERLEALAARFRERDWFFAPPPAADPYWILSRRIAGFRPAAHWKQVHVPVLLLYGDGDERIPVRESVQAITTALNAARNNTVCTVVLPHADHSFTILPVPADGWERKVPGFADRLIAWAVHPTACRQVINEER